MNEEQAGGSSQSSHGAVSHVPHVPEAMTNMDVTSMETEPLVTLPVAELEALEAQVPSPHEQELLDYARGAKLAVPELVSLTIEAGALAAMNEQQARTIAVHQEHIAALQERLRRVLATLKAHGIDIGDREAGTGGTGGASP